MSLRLQVNLIITVLLGLMASLLGKPLMLVNADAALLLSNKALLPVADRVAFGFDGQAARATRRALVTGNPVRAEIEALPAPAERYAGRSGPLKLLVVGGSLGAQVLNTTLPAALDGLGRALASGERFDPGTTRRTFRLATLDYFELVVLEHFLAQLRRLDRLEPVDDAQQPPRQLAARVVRHLALEQLARLLAERDALGVGS